MVVKVYGATYAACSQRVLTCLIELGFEFELIPVDLQSGEHKKPHNVQPFGQVPAIEDGDFKLFESRAIIRYYAAKSGSEGGVNLLGDTLEERGVVEQWVEVEVNNYNPLIYTMVLQLLVLPQMGQVGDMELVRDCKGKLEKVLDVYEERLSKSKYLGGERFTIADLTHLPNTRFLMEEGGMEDLIKRRKNVYNWWIHISSRPSWKKVMDLPK
ncbi:glutathione S-transferase phi 12 [Perilla frutescens var. hirtella]|uniref:glutathione transferase n=1 Tax=Perilla frutescens var. hirtella TaxID=608512 RepID=A0AAD4JPI1_PERFH|nr:glutathione S-transferase phi 12 [Perilla frutescens var. hirtella]KAH6837613.1 glutathione S-transferase phi 12 [Perilla frutescens var. hirtella]